MGSSHPIAGSPEPLGGQVLPFLSPDGTRGQSRSPGSAKHGQATPISPQWVGTCCVYRVFIAHSETPKFKFALFSILQTGFEHGLNSDGAGLGAKEPAALRLVTPARGLGRSLLRPLTAVSSSVK